MHRKTSQEVTIPPPHLPGLWLVFCDTRFFLCHADLVPLTVLYFCWLRTFGFVSAASCIETPAWNFKCLSWRCSWIWGYRFLSFPNVFFTPAVFSVSSWGAGCSAGCVWFQELKHFISRPGNKNNKRCYPVYGPNVCSFWAFWRMYFLSTWRIGRCPSFLASTRLQSFEPIGSTQAQAASSCCPIRSEL